MKTLREYLDIISEAEKHTSFEPSTVTALPHGQRWDDLDNSSPYKSYRFGVALAGSPEGEMTLNGPVGQKMMTIAYSDADQKILDAAGKQLGFAPSSVSPKGSSEHTGTNTTSPVKGFRGY